MTTEEQRLIAKGIALIYTLGAHPDMHEKAAEVMVGLACQIGIDPGLVTEEAADLVNSIALAQMAERVAN